MKTEVSCAAGMLPGSGKFQIFFNCCLTAVLLCAALSFKAGAETLNFGNLDGTQLSFSGGAFNFTSVGGYQFSISSVSGGFGDSVGLKGYIAPGGPFSIGPITTNGWVQSANVSGTGMLHITDNSSLDLTGSIQWDDITTITSVGALNLTGTINLTGLSYSGVNIDLGVLAASGSAEDVVSFQFVPAKTLGELAGPGGETSYSGSIATVTPTPEPGTLALLGMGLAGFLALGRRRNQ